MHEILHFALAMTGERPVEITAVILGLINITLLIRRNIWNYPFGIVMVSLYAWIFYGAKLYSDVLLQGFFFVVQFYGWYYWLKGRGGDGRVIVERLTKGQALGYAGVAVAGVAALGTVMGRFTDAAFPYWDASIAVLSVIAQILLARRRLENWILWITVDVLAIGLYWVKGLHPTAALYLLFLILSGVGFLTWLNAWRNGEAVS
ncbi:MAG: nicotinamide riboside transporter PnuC [Parvularculaceae bacterium]